ncbi:MAG: bifunctional phosphoglucose/phosphomannose isomerase [bacterium]|nr:bifunctional phosphoglucose/phosphomannose isomerase [bacterium]
MLDDLKYIHEKDGQDALGVAEKQWQQLEHVFDLGDFNLPSGAVHNVVVGGMGGSALAALISQTWPGYSVPFEISRDYSIPQHVSDKTLFVASSHSGNTEETMEALQAALAKKAQIVVIATGGKLQKMAEEYKLPFALIPGGLQPRHAALYSLKALVTVLERASLVARNDAETTLHQAAGYLRDSVAAWRPDVPTKDNVAKQIALEMSGNSPVIYAGPELFPAAYKWKISFNENAKNVAWCNQFPEFNHNEFLGWTSHPVDKPYKVVELRSNLEHPRTIKRFEVTNKLLSGRWPNPHVIDVQGEGLLQQLLWTIALGDFVSVYVALLNGLNPSPVDLIEKFKSELSN